MSDMREGGCLCGAVRYKIDVAEHISSNCHCTDCRRQSGAPYIAFTDVLVDKFQWIKAPKGVLKFGDTSLRRFCDGCGAFMMWESQAGDEYLSISTATIDDPSGLVPTSEIYTKSRMDGISPVEGAKQYLESDD